MQLRAGTFTLLYEKGFLRYISYDKTEILRMIYFALRDENWGTMDVIIKNEIIRSRQNSFFISYDCCHQQKGTDIFCWQVMINGSENGEITFEIEGYARVEFLKNRLGFCVLHPIGDYRGQQVEITHPDKTVTQTSFPEPIANDDPFRQIASLKWQKNNSWYNLGFEGDIFETEDQRNWTDASFKTFCTPHDLPVPVKVMHGERIHQKIVFSAVDDLPVLPVGKSNLIEITMTGQILELPKIGIAAAEVANQISAKAGALLRDLKLKHYAITVDLSREHWTAQFFSDTENAGILQLPLQVTLQLSENFLGEINVFTALCHQLKADVKSILLLSKNELVTSKQLIDHSWVIKEQFPDVPVGVGTDYNFKEINRCRFNTSGAEFIGYAIHPQEHASDDLSLIENIAAQADTVKTAKHIYGENISVYISPVTLKKRFNPYASDPALITRSDNERNDSRQNKSFCSVFTLGSIKSLTVAQADSITYFKTLGNQGVISDSNEPFPVYFALKNVLNNSSAIINTGSSDPLAVDSMLFKDGLLLLWNYTNAEQTALMFDGKSIKLRPHQIKTIAVELN
ncbi:hypothetical protein SNE25_30215 [Mucilaginibacter sabulilitoris]|uniref:Uncharacterized protein n=1 Tax=Mucilaginibacter sabulilitoris TaxID=1173583 RepID=A0ABZ0TK94_9SPHI|nr:hypothetical protein [Mucilaginibacter sabulilitoris]WPU93596.1 hypothetical protein SNE25_30215 [Mucilaginibacter sabulilitoris]